MTTDLEVRSESQGTRFLLPKRDNPTARWVGCFPILFGMFFCGFALFWMAGAAGLLDGDPRPVGPEGPVGPAPGFHWFNLIFALFGIPFFLAGLVPITVGLGLFVGSHTELLVTDAELISIERFWRIPVRRRRPLAAVTGLRIGPAFQSTHNSGAAGLALIAVCDGAADLTMAARHPRPRLESLADALSEELTRRRTAVVLQTGTIAPAPITLESLPEPAEEPARDLSIADSSAAPEAIPDQPAESKIVFIGTPDSLTFMVPRTGFQGVARFFLLFSLVWNGITGCVFTGFAAAFLSHPSFEDLFPLLFILLFFAIGICMALAAVQTAFRKAVILATREALVYTQTGPVRNVEHQWKPDDIAFICCDDSGTAINDRPLQDLQIWDRNSAKKGFFDGRDKTELEWLAGTLRAFYGKAPR